LSQAQVDLGVSGLELGHERRQDAPAGSRPARARSADLARGPVEEVRAEMALELLQAVAHHRRRQAHVTAGRRQAAELDHPDEDPDVLEQRHDPGVPAQPRLFAFV
jgi:hypothetical protein